MAEPVPTPRRRGRGGCLLAAGGTLALIVLLPVVLYVIWGRVAAQQAAHQVAKLQDRGHPTNAAELNAYYALPADRQDATNLWLGAVEPLVSPDFREEAQKLPVIGNGGDPPPPGQPWAEQSKVEALLKKYAEAMRQLHEAAGTGPARYDLNFQDGYAMELKRAQDLRNAARMLSLEAQVRAHRGDADGTADSLRSGLQLSESLAYEPALVSQLIRIAVASTFYSLVGELVPNTEFSDDDLASLQRAIRQADYAKGVQRGLIGERAMAIQAIRDPSSLSEMGNVPRIGGRNEDLAKYLELMGPVIDALELSWLEARQAADNADAELTSMATSYLTRMRFVMTTMLFPANNAFINAGSRSEACRNLADTLIAVERYRRVQGGPPTSLQQLVPKFLPEVPVDPFDGQPLRYRVDSNEVIVYSIGEDGADGGGADVPANADLVVRLPLASEKNASQP